ncbi:MAG: hypothetical protein CM1200mP41_25270 [Gammaproteobacteria bacterium]|nr:MAG: hypothetical protein CM1200mP41_25270 [Gammaproteobacteria bacterium]
MNWFAVPKRTSAPLARGFVYHRFGMSVKKVAPAVNRDPAVRISCRVIGPADHRCGAATVTVHRIGWGTEPVAIFRSVVRASMKTAVTKELLIPQKDHIGSAGRAGKLMGTAGEPRDQNRRPPGQ